MVKELVDFWNTGDNANKIILLVVGAVIGLILKEVVWVGLVKFVKWGAVKIYLLFKKGKEKLASFIKKIKRRRKYKKTIKQIERKEIEIPKFFLTNKSKEANPELRKIFEMIEKEEIKAPATYRLNQLLKENPDVLANINEQMKKPITQHMPVPKMVDLKDFTNKK